MIERTYYSLKFKTITDLIKYANTSLTNKEELVSHCINADGEYEAIFAIFTEKNLNGAYNYTYNRKPKEVTPNYKPIFT